MVLLSCRLDLYCENENSCKGTNTGSFPMSWATFTGSTRLIVMKKAKRAGWKITKDGKAFCKECLSAKQQTDKKDTKK